MHLNPDPLHFLSSSLPPPLSTHTHTHTHTHAILSSPDPTSITMIITATIFIESGQVNLGPLPFTGASKLRRFEIALAETVQAKNVLRVLIKIDGELMQHDPT